MRKYYFSKFFSLVTIYNLRKIFNKLLERSTLSSMKGSEKKLTFLQKGGLQKIFAFLVYIIIASSLALIYDYIDKYTFISIIERAYNDGILVSSDIFVLKKLIYTREGHIFILYTAFLLVCGFVSWRIIRWAGHSNLSTPVTLDKVVEFKFCMNELGIADPRRAFDVAIRYNLPFYIADHPLLMPTKKDVNVKFYSYSFNSGMRDMEILERCLGRQTLCLAMEDFIVLKNRYQDQLVAAHVSTIVNLKKLAEGLEASLIIERESYQKLQEELAALREENRKLQKKQQTSQAREGKGEETRDIKKIPYWRVAIPTVERLLQAATPTTKYTSSQIQAAFEEELKRFPHLQEAIKIYFAEKRQTERDNPFSLDGWPMRMIRAALGEYIQTASGPPKKSRV